MVGKRTRCHNRICGTIFEVRDESNAEPGPTNATQPPPATVPAETPRHSSNVGDIVPILTAEVVPEYGAPEASAIPPSPEVVVPAAPMIPFLNAEAIQEPESEPYQETAAWQLPPPVRRSTGASSPDLRPPAPTVTENTTKIDKKPRPATTKRKPATRPAATQHAIELPAEIPNIPAPPQARIEPPAPTQPKPPEPEPFAGPVELPPGAWDAPPVRRGDEPTAPAHDPGHTFGSDGSFEPEPASAVAARRRAKWIMGGVISTAAVVIIGIGLYVLGVLRVNIERIAAEAQKEMEAHHYAAAKAKYTELIGLTESNPEKQEEFERFHFLEEFCGVMAGVYVISDPNKEVQNVQDFLKRNQDHKLIKENAAHLGDAYFKLAEDLTEKAKQNLSFDHTAKAEEILQEGERHHGGKAAAKANEIRARIGDVKVAIEREQQRIDLYKKGEELVRRPSVEAPEIFSKEVDRVKRDQPEIEKDPKVIALRSEIEQNLVKLVTWNPGESKLPDVPEEVEPSLLVVPSLITNATAATDKGRVIFAIAQGVLYALDRGTGRLEWATRVGIDTTALPVRLPASESFPTEIALVLSSDTNTLTARETQKGQPRWRHQLSAPCLGRPVIVKGRAYVPTYDGRVHVIEVIEGKLLGWYNIGLPLTVGAVHQEGTDLLYIPADNRYVYVLNIAHENREPACKAILHSGHPSGSLRTEPIIVSREDERKQFQLQNDAWPDYLILNQAEGINAMRLRVFPLPIQGPAGAPLMTREPEVKGWSWFPPYHDHERLVQVTDAGILGLIGIKQVRNQDKDLFLETKNELTLPSHSTGTGRAQLVHVVEDDIWALIQGELQLLHFDLYGQRVVPLMNPLPLGSPLHGSQLDEARKTLFLVTQSLSSPTSRATAVETSTFSPGHIRWQRQLGFLCQRDPINLGGPVLAVDEGGSVFLFDPKQHPYRHDHEWQLGGQILEKPFSEGMLAAYFLTGEDGKSAYAIASAKGKGVFIRRYIVGQKVLEKFVESATLSGLPAVGDNAVVLPLADGKLRHVPLNDGRPYDGPNWRALSADRDSTGLVIHLTGDEFLTSDGNRKLIHWRWPGGPMWDKVAEVELPDRIATGAVRLAGEAGTQLVAIADVRGNLSLLSKPLLDAKKSTWTIARTWKLGGNITAGPFVRGSLLGCVMDHQRLVWLDPAKDLPLWEYRDGSDVIVGQPQIVNDIVVVAHRSGHFVGLDPATGRPFGPGYRLRANVAPVSAPVEFGSGRVFAPLTDGTVLMMSLLHLRHPANGFPIH